MADNGFVFTVDGVRYDLDLQEITGREAKEFRIATGEPLRRALDLFLLNPQDVDIDTLAGIIWLARRQAGDLVDYDAVLGSVNYGTDFSARASEAVDLPQL